MLSSNKSYHWLNNQMETVVMGVLTTIVSTLDDEVDAHARRTAHFAEATARKLGRSEEEQHLVRLAALVHDVGKIGIPEAIRHKPGPLTQDEWMIMRLHPEIGKQILEQAGGVFQTIATIVVAHHERWDGHGYPFGLKGNKIPIGARILSVVDSYDAMIFQRPYREPLSEVQARDELRRCAGSQYDPCVVEAFLYVLDEQRQEVELAAENREEKHGTELEAIFPSQRSNSNHYHRCACSR